MAIKRTYTQARANFESVLETAHLLRSPKNAQRLFEALRQAQAKKGKPESLARLRADLGLDRDK